MRFRLFPALLLAAAAGAGRPVSAGPLRIVTTTEDLASLAREVTGGRGSVTPIARGYQDPHFVEPKPSYLIQLRRADVLIAVGLELEVGWLPALLQQARNPKLLSPAHYLDASTSAEILEKPTERVTKAMGDVHPFGNPHYWLNPANGRAVAQAISEKVSALDPEGSSGYQTNLQRFLDRLSAKEKEWDSRMAPYAGTEIVTYHNSWPNFAKRFRLKVVGYVEPKPGVPPGPAHVASLIEMMRQRKVPLIVMEPYFDSKLPQSIATKTGATLLVFPPSVGGVEEARDYFSLFDHDIGLFVRAMEARKK